ncbi:hypothetical protein, partial [Escherichia coli]|uniref:hypothetical protein n=1 Tax=Escherichia coli TaxID=562 RepID=UPI0032D9A925
PDTACGLQAEKTGRFSLHWRDNTRPDKTRKASHQAFAAALLYSEYVRSKAVPFTLDVPRYYGTLKPVNVPGWLNRYHPGNPGSRR